MERTLQKIFRAMVHYPSLVRAGNHSASHLLESQFMVHPLIYSFGCCRTIYGKEISDAEEKNRMSGKRYVA